MYGAILGDIAGSRFEFSKPQGFDWRTADLFGAMSAFTDDTVLTVATKYAVLTGTPYAKAYALFGRRYSRVGYGTLFKNWLNTGSQKGYNSFGNGSAMRVSPVGWAFETLEETLNAAKQSAEVTHNHPEGIKGAQAMASAVYLARTGKSKREIKEYIESAFGYDLNRTCDDIRPDYRFDVTCQGSVPESIIAFLEGADYESTIRLAISLGGDADTMAAIAGGIAEAYYREIPLHIKEEALRRLPDEFVGIMSRFYRRFVSKVK